MRLPNLAESECSETDLNQRPIVKNLVLDRLQCDNLGHMRFHHKVSSFSQFVVNCVEVNLMESHTNTLFRQAPFLYDFRQFSDSFLRVGQEVDTRRCSAKTLLDCSVNAVILVVDIVEFDDCDAVLILMLLKFVEVV